MTTATTTLLKRMEKLERSSDERFDDEDLDREETAVMNELVKRGLVVEVEHKDSNGDFVFYSYELTTAGKEAAVSTWY